MTDLIIIFIILIIVILLSGIVHRCSDCGKMFSVKRVNHQGYRKIICKNCGKEK